MRQYVIEANLSTFFCHNYNCYRVLFLTLRKYKQAQPQEEDDETPPLNAIETFYGVHFRDGAWQNEHDETAYVSVLLYLF